MLRFARLSAALATTSVLLIATARDAYAIGQSTGRVTGTVTEAQTQAPVPGAAVTVSGGSGVHKKTQTGDDGTYEIRDIPPGTYDLVVSYEGMKPIKRRVVVRPDEATPVLIEWSAEAAGGDDGRPGGAPPHEPGLAADGAGRLGRAREPAPALAPYQAIATQIPGVTANGGGNPNVKGATSRNNRYVVNGLDLTDPVTNTFSANFQQDSLESIR